MHRRDFLAGSTLAGAGGIALAGCAPTLGSPLLASGDYPLPDPAEIERRWAHVEAARAAILERPPLKLDGLLPNGRSKGRVAPAGELARKGIRSLLLAGAFRDLPEEARVHPAVQDSLFDAMPELDEAVFGMKARIEQLSTTEHADISRELRRDPELAERVMALLDDEAAAVEVSDARRMHMRRLGLSICDRLHQSSELLLGEYHEKLEKVAARHGSHAEIERRTVAAMGEQAFQAMCARSLRAAQAYKTFEVAGARRKLGTDGQPLQLDHHEGRKARVLTAGGITLGIGLGLGALGGVLLATGGFAGAFVLTVAGLSVLAGIIVLIVGAVID